MESEATLVRQKKSMSIPEMGRLLGLKKTESYYLLHKGFFEIITIGNNMRVMVDSFEEWYAGQFHYKKVDGPAPGSKWTDTTMSITETAELIGISNWEIYELIKIKPFKITTISNKKRVNKESFEQWYNNQTKYKKINT
ncbi:MAG: DNA-binding protein [Clostridia bacterium]|nr:DNA-binding protein [Clostridia bacterium]